MIADNNNTQSVTPRVEGAPRLVMISSGSLFGNSVRQFLQSAGYCLVMLGPDNLRRFHGDLVLLDSGSFSKDQCRDVFQLAGSTPVVLINTQEPLARELIQQHPHIRGVFYPACKRDNLIQGMQTILEGGDWLPRSLMQHLVDRYRQLNHHSAAISSLSTREVEVLALAGRGLSNAAIADKVNLSVHTVKSHIHHALQKLDANNRAHGAALVLGHIEGAVR